MPTLRVNITLVNC